MHKVMIVDDDKSILKLLQTLLELDGYEVKTVARGGDVMAAARLVPPDLVLMDYHLLDMDGVDVLRDLRQDTAFANTPVIMTSGLAVEEEVLEAGASAFLAKPFDPDELTRTIAQLLATT